MKTSDATSAFLTGIEAAIHAAGLELSCRQIGVLLTVARRPGPHTPGSLAKALRLSAPAISRALDRLSALDLIERRTAPTDRRTSLIHLRLSGARYVRALDAALTQAWAEPALSTSVAA